MDMSGKDTNIEAKEGSDNHVNYHAPNMSSDWQVSGNNLTTTSIGLIPMGNPTHFNNQWTPNAMLKGNMFLPAVSGVPPQSLPHFPADSAFIERAARFSCFGGGNLVEMMNPFSIHDPLNPFSRVLGPMQGQHEVFGENASKPHSGMQLPRSEMNMIEVSKEALQPPFKNEKKSESFMRSHGEGKRGVGLSGNESDEAEFSGRGGQEELDGAGGESSGKGFGSKKRKRGTQVTEQNENNEAPQTSIETTEKQKGDQNVTSINKPGGKNGKQGSQGSDQPKEEYIHIRARRGQATNSHSLAERVRREKISERMKFLQDLVPGCSKVTGKAVMLDEIINYVQSLQRQVEFLSMKLATVNPRLDFNIEGLLAKDIPNVWDDELHNIVHMGFNSSAPVNSQDLSGSLPPGHMKAEP
ncbi:hypothetical protein DH2020_032302 [Rehmannia glutinosa]|uniref:BHLH domain-containing protein n=1 Tax=Rehmannia glutinosa TaxID=99300 RepID=A0ABR0VIH6_REHGL